MNTIRHNLNLKWRDELVVAPRKFVIDNDIIRYVHILDDDCTFVLLFDHLRYTKDFCVQVAMANLLKIHSCTKGLYFNYSYYIDEYKKKTIRVYLCD